MKFTEEQMVRAMRENDAGYDGRFYVGVHSTGIYCLPSCKAKLPLLKNVRFYATREEAIAAGLRGCKRCRSAQYPDVLPDWLHQVLDFMRAHPGERLTENDLVAQAGVDISTIRRHFRQTLDITPLAFHRRLRLAEAKRLLESGHDYLTAAFECGFESASGFRDAFKNEFGSPPGRFYAQQ
jgi:AraC family transcriptional regulator of adaptative response/methylated-DNA-[protein]-cysteine methyltransferase